MQYFQFLLTQSQEQNQPESSLAVSSSDQLIGCVSTPPPELDSGDEVGSVSEDSVLLVPIPRTLLSVTIPHSDTVQCPDRLEGKQSREGEQKNKSRLFYD